MAMQQAPCARMLPERAVEDTRKRELRHIARACFLNAPRRRQKVRAASQRARTEHGGEAREESARDFVLALDYCC